MISAKNMVVGDDMDLRNPVHIGYTYCIVCGKKWKNTYGVDRPFVCPTCNDAVARGDVQ